jgi:2-oxoglutarate ferredoxin oxidoreductase subunit alpha
MMDRLKKKYHTARKYVPAPVLHKMTGAKAGIIAFGSSEAAVLEAQHDLAATHDLKCDFMRIRALPFTDEVTDFIKRYDQVFVIELNRDGQMGQLLVIEYPDQASKFISVALGDGLPASAKWVRDGILARWTSKAERPKVVIKTPRKTMVASNNGKGKTSSSRKNDKSVSSKRKK